MLISSEKVKELLAQYNINIHSVLHIGSHICEEAHFYNELNAQDVIWIDANESLVHKMKKEGVDHVFHAVISDEDDKDVIFNVANNGQSSSILELGTHKHEHPQIYYTHHIPSKTMTIDTFFKTHSLDPTKYNFWNLDIQGAELKALKGGIQAIKSALVIYIEVNEKELYQNCGMLGEIDALLESFHFKRVLTEMTPHSWGDALYIKI